MSLENNSDFDNLSVIVTKNNQQDSSHSGHLLQKNEAFGNDHVCSHFINLHC